jgi:hypothetical protein
MSTEALVGLGVAVASLFFVYIVKAMPAWLAWGGFAAGMFTVVWALLPEHERFPIIPTVCLIISLGSAVACVGWVWSSIAGAASPFFYFRADILDQTNLQAANPLRIVNDGSVPYENVDTWFSPSAAHRDPNRSDQLYFALRTLKIFMPILHTGEFRTGTELAPGDYCVEYNGVRGGLSIGFLERLQLITFQGRLVQVIDVWVAGKNVYSSSRPAGFTDTPVPWPLNGPAS